MISDLYITSVMLRQMTDQRAGYVFELPVIKTLDRLGQIKFNKKVTFLVGENGTGKSTLLEAIAVASGFNAEGGTRNFNFATSETHSDLSRHLIVSKGVKRPSDGFFLRAESFYNVATEIDRLNTIQAGRSMLDSYGGKSLHEQSHGESFLSLVLNRFGGKGLYILDEPEAALSPSRQMTLLAAINDLVHKESQFIIATHSPILMAFPGADIYVLSDDDICLTPYEKTEHYDLTRRFLNNPGKMLKILLDQGTDT